MKYTLTHHHGLGNDFLVFDVAQGMPQEQWSDLAVRWCDRSAGQGADGLLVLDCKSAQELTMILFNADGSRAEMSGNGIRCLVQAAHQLNDSGVGTQYVVSTDAGTREVVVLAVDGDDTLQISVDMGTVEPIPEPTQWQLVECHPDRPARHLSVGNPHSVVGVDDVLLVDLKSLGEKVPHVNLEIIEPGPEPYAITMRVHERGAGITQACGTGACAAAEAALAWGLVPRNTEEVLVHMDGGDARVRIDNNRRATLIGTTVYLKTITVDA
ncbi:MAG: diaminopimelate epimerase [Ilumatobacteraceae bacterium]|nr:diaminopimelate epimerase [Ilumatobacteraceae bacterium]